MYPSFFFNPPRDFAHTYRCFSLNRKKRDLEYGGKIILPPSALSELAHLKITFPMQFELSNPHPHPQSQNGDKITKTHCGVQEFIAEEGLCYVPTWMMEKLGVNEGSFIHVRNIELKIGKFVKFRPHQTAFLKVSNPKAVLENTLRNFSAFTKDDVIVIQYNNKDYKFDVCEIQPSSPQHAISITEADIEVDFAPPLDYQEETPQKPTPTPTTPSVNSSATQPTTVPESPKNSFAAFVGTGYRLDGKSNPTTTTTTTTTTPTAANTKTATTPSKSPQTTTAPPPSRLVFGGAKASQPTKPVEAPKGSSTTTSTEQQKKFVPFSGQGFSLKG